MKLVKKPVKNAKAKPNTANSCHPFMFPILAPTDL